jgi:hypothetical protein
MRYRNKSLIFSTHQCISGRNPPSKLVHRNPDSERSLLVLLWASPAARAPGVFFVSSDIIFLPISYGALLFPT